MPSIKQYNQTGTETGSIELNPKFFGVKVNPAFVHEVLVAQQANARHPIANVKSRGDVQGGGKKPWKQKGTGRARQGSIRSPQWVGGGQAFGPKSDKNFSVKVNRKAKQKALFMALSDKVTNNNMFALEGFKPEAVKTKFAVNLFKALPVHRKALAVVSKSNPDLLRMVRNLQNIKLVTVNSMNLEDVLAYNTLVFWSDTVSAFESLYGKA